jgi:hypothetical protein
VLRLSFPGVVREPDRLRERIERLRGHSEVLERLGVPSVRHRPSSAAMLGLLMAFHDELPMVANGVPARVRDRAMDELLGLGRIRNAATGWRGALEAERRLRAATGRAGALREVVDRASELWTHPSVTGLETRLEASPEWRAYPEFVEAWEWLEDQDVACAITSEGEEPVQRSKLDRLGLGRLQDRLVTTGRAASPLDAAALRGRVEALLETERGGGAGSQLRALYPFVWVLDEFGSKAREYWRRAVNACAASPEDPVAGLDALAVPADATLAHVLVVGDNAPKDGAPVAELLGPAASVWLLDQGKHPSRTDDDAGEMFANWQAAGAELRRRWPLEDRAVPVPPLLSPRQRAAVGDARASETDLSILREFDIVEHLMDLAESPG